MTDATIDIATVHELVGRWWLNYDEGEFEVLTRLLTDDAHFSCRTDTGTTDYEEFVRADIQGRGDVMAWQTQHRLDSTSSSDGRTRPTSAPTSM
jgi:SnoaL-like domain